MLQLYTNYDRVTIPVTNYILCPYMNNKLSLMMWMAGNLNLRMQVTITGTRYYISMAKGTYYEL